MEPTKLRGISELDRALTRIRSNFNRRLAMKRAPTVPQTRIAPETTVIPFPVPAHDRTPSELAPPPPTAPRSAAFSFIPRMFRSWLWGSSESDR